MFIGEEQSLWIQQTELSWNLLFNVFKLLIIFWLRSLICRLHICMWLWIHKRLLSWNASYTLCTWLQYWRDGVKSKTINISINTQHVLFWKKIFHIYILLNLFFWWHCEIHYSLWYVCYLFSWCDFKVHIWEIREVFLRQHSRSGRFSMGTRFRKLPFYIKYIH